MDDAKSKWHHTVVGPKLWPYRSTASFGQAPSPYTFNIEAIIKQKDVKWGERGIGIKGGNDDNVTHPFDDVLSLLWAVWV